MAAIDLTREQRAEIEKAQKAADALKARYRPLSDDHKDILFQEARSQNGWLDEPVTDAQLHELYALTKMGATSMNSCPARFVFLRSNDEKERLKPALAEPNIAKTMSAPVVAIIGYDSAFHKHMGKLFPHRDVKPMFEHNEALREATAFRNGTLQGAYLIMAARAIGLDCGPMSGFNNSAVDEIFFKDTTVKSNFLCCLGQGDSTKLFQRLPRFEFSEVCQIK